jgi:hypothetical protein
MPTIKDACSVRNVGVGADVLLDRGTLKCDGAISPDGRVMGAVKSGRAFTVLNFSRLQSYQYDRK